jgi:Type IV secretory pathway, VirB3-like protein
MEQAEAITGYYAPVHRALTEPILLGGAPRAVAIVNGTLAAAVGLGLRLWIAGAAIWRLSGPPSATPPSSTWCAGTCATRSTWLREAMR